MTVQDFGWIAPKDRTPDQHFAHAAIMQALPKFAITGKRFAPPPPKNCLWEAWKDPQVLAATGGKVFTGFHQLTGSCVGVGGGNAVFTLSAVEVVRLHDPEQALVPFWPLPYGRSRFLMGDRGPGEGSLGSTFAEAMRKEGIIAANLDGLPGYTDSDGITYTESIEMKWSDGSRIEQKWMDLAKNHLVKTTATVRNSAEAKDALANNYPLTWAGDWGGRMQCPTKGEPAVLLNERAGTWNHQQSCLGYWEHPSLGLIFWIQNQWGVETHGRDPAGGPGGGYWILAKDMDYQCRTGEVFAFSQFQGFPAATFDWSNVV